MKLNLIKKIRILSSSSYLKSRYVHRECFEKTHEYGKKMFSFLLLSCATNFLLKILPRDFSPFAYCRFLFGNFFFAI